MTAEISVDGKIFGPYERNLSNTSRLTGKRSVVSATFLLTLDKMVDVETLHETGRGMQEEENFPWSDEMVEQLQAYKIEMEFKGLDFDAANVHSIHVTGTVKNFTR